MKGPRRCRRCSHADTWWVVRIASGREVLAPTKPAAGDGAQEVMRQVVVGTDGLCQDCRSLPMRNAAKGQRSLFE
jgi:hypothetical protein